jgi:hypothetical protein
MSDNNLEDLANSIIHTENFNHMMDQISRLEHSIISLGEDKNYLEQLKMSYVEMYLIKTPVASTNDYIQFRREYTNHLLDIVKVKSPKNYDILKREFEE